MSLSKITKVCIKRAVRLCMLHIRTAQEGYPFSGRLSMIYGLVTELRAVSISAGLPSKITSPPER